MPAVSRATLAFAAVLPVATIATFFVVSDVRLLVDPCHTWGLESGGSGTLSPNDPCASGRSASSQTLAEYIAVALAIKGSMLVGAGLAAFGIVRARGIASAAGAWVIALASVPLFLGVTAHAVLLSAALIAAAARHANDLRGGSLWAVRALALAAGLVYGVLLAGAIQSGSSVWLILSVATLVTPAILLWAARPVS